MQTWKFSWEFVLSPPAEKVLRFLQLSIKTQVITVLFSSTYATITYYQFSFLRFLQIKAMRYVLDPLHCYSLDAKEAL